MANVHRFELGLRATRVMSARGCSFNDLQVHIITSGLPLAKMMTVSFICNISFAFGPIKYRIIGVKFNAIYLYIGGLN